MTKIQKVKLGLALFPVGFLISFFCLWASLIGPVCNFLQSRNWPKVQCVIEQYDVREAGLFQSKFRGNQVLYRTQIQYSYWLKGQKYLSERYSFWDALPRAAVLEPPIPQMCYVNPKNPNEAVLCRNVDVYYILISSLPLFGLCGCGYGIYDCFRKMKGVQHF